MLSIVTRIAASRAARVPVSHVDGPPITQNTIHGMNPTTGWLARRSPAGSSLGGPDACAWPVGVADCRAGATFAPERGHARPRRGEPPPRPLPARLPPIAVSHRLNLGCHR